MTPPILENEKGMALISVYLVGTFLMLISAASFSKSLFELRQVQRETFRLQSYAAAEAGIQSALAQIGQNAYTGFINTGAITIPTFQASDGTQAGSFSVTVSYPDQADWVIIQASGASGTDSRNLEARVFLDSNLSKYLVYAITTAFASGDDAQYGTSDGTNPEGVPANSNDRTQLYFTGTWDINGTNIQLYGDAHAEVLIDGSSASEVHGDTYSSAFQTNAWGSVTNSGVTGGLLIGDGFADDIDRNGDLTVNAQDYPDYHDLTATGGGDAHATETLVQINHTFYSANNNTPAFVGSTAKDRYLEFQSIASGTRTRVVEYNEVGMKTVKANYDLPASAIVYVKGKIYCKGYIGGRVSVVSSDDIYLDGNVAYTGNQKNADPTHSVAFLAKDKIMFRPNQLEVSGILYGENSSSASAVFDSDYNLSNQYSPGTKDRLRLYGNRVMKGSTNLSNYGDRVYGYDPNLKYYRPPGIPVRPSLRTVREL